MGRYQVTCGREMPSPYLVKQWDKTLKQRLANGARAVDLGCGNGRNSKFLRSKGLRVEGFDACLEEQNKRVVLGKDVVPVKANSVDLILLNYVLMFLSEAEMVQLAGEVGRIAKRGCVVVIEMYPAKDSHDTTNEMCEVAMTMFKRFLLRSQSWEPIHETKMRQILERTEEDA